MNGRMAIAIIGLAALLCAGAHAQQRPILSPRDSVFLRFDTSTIGVNYGRPSIRGRIIMGHLVPWNQVWRTGANEATHLATNFDMVMGGVPVPRGRYTLWTLPSPDGWQVIINKQTGQWGTVYNPALDLARFPATVEKLTAAVDTFTIAFQATGASTGTMRLLWENTAVSIPFQKKERVTPLSPNDSAAVSLGGSRISIGYSRPFVRGRVIWGVVVPFDSVWRTGANLATSLVTERDVTIGDVTIPRGRYTLYSIPEAEHLTLIVSKKPGGGPPAYDQREELARIVMKAETTLTPIDPFRIWMEKTGDTAATLRLGWSDKAYSTTIRTH